MPDTFTKRNHYNPCFWTAYWNPDFFEAVISNSRHIGDVREQKILALNLRSDAIHQIKVKDVFYQKNLGIAEITPESMKRFCKKYYPSKYNSFCEEVDQNPETLYLDFEDVLRGMENKGIYNALIEVVRTGTLSSIDHKGLLISILIVHAMRSYELMTSMSDSSLDKWEYFWLLKNAWANPLVLARAVAPLVLGQWTFYHASKHAYPLCDSPIMIGKDNLMAILSPRLLLEINLKINNTANCLCLHQDISATKFREFRLRAIHNTFKDIISHDRTELERWHTTPEFRKRVAEINDPSTERQAIRRAATHIMWAIEGFGRVPPDFEQWVKPYFSTPNH